MTIRIVAAACRRGGLVFSLPVPARHGTIMRSMDENSICPFIPPEDQGFLTSEGRFVDRVEAKRIVAESGQPLRPGVFHHPEKLFSEDLW